MAEDTQNKGSGAAGSSYHSKAQEHPHLIWQMFLPQYWKDWFLMLLVRFIILFPYPLFMKFGRMLGILCMHILKRRKKITEQNFRLALPELTDAEVADLTREHFANCGMGIFETAMAWYWPEKRLRKLVHIDPDQEKKAQEIAKSGKGIVVLTCHFVTLELMARIYGTYIKKGVGVYRPNDNIVIEYLQVKGRTRSNLYLVDRRKIKPIIKALMQGLPIWYAPDQDYGRRAAVFVPFFGVKDAATVTGTSGFARVKNTVVQPSYTIRLPDYQGYKLVIDDILEDFPGGNETEDAARCNKIIEGMIKQALPQYMWVHRRFKTTPNPEDPSRYHDI